MARKELEHHSAGHGPPQGRLQHAFLQQFVIVPIR